MLMTLTEALLLDILENQEAIMRALACARDTPVAVSDELTSLVVATEKTIADVKRQFQPSTSSPRADE